MLQENWMRSVAGATRKTEKAYWILAKEAQQVRKGLWNQPKGLSRRFMGPYFITTVYRGSSRFTTHTDHEALRWIQNKTDATGKLARWPLRPYELDYDVVHLAGVKYKAADALLRMEMTGMDNSEVNDEVTILLMENDKDEGN